jgi:hypothetical protein
MHAYLNRFAISSSPLQRSMTCSRAMCSVSASLLMESLRVKNFEVCSRETKLEASRLRRMVSSVASGSWSKDCPWLSMVKGCILVRLSAISGAQTLHCLYIDVCNMFNLLKNGYVTKLLNLLLLELAHFKGIGA